MARTANWSDPEDDASAGDGVAFELAVRHASGSAGLAVDLVRAHRWKGMRGRPQLRDPGGARASCGERPANPRSQPAPG